MPTYSFVVKFFVEGMSGLQSMTVTAQNAAQAKDYVRELWGDKIKSFHSATRA